MIHDVEKRSAKTAKLEAGVSNHHRATIANLKAQVMNSQAEIAKLREEIHMSELYNASSTTPYLCAVSLIKYIEEFVLEVARKVISEFLSIHSLTHQEKSALLKAAKSSTFQDFRNQIQNLESVSMKETILSSVQQKFLEGIEGVGNTHNNLDLVLEFEEFWYFWELCNLGRAELFDWDLCQGKQIDPEMRLARARIQVKFLKDIEGRNQNPLSSMEANDIAHGYVQNLKLDKPEHVFCLFANCQNLQTTCLYGC